MKIYDPLKVLHITQPTDVISQSSGYGNSFCGNRTLLLIDRNTNSNFNSSLLSISGDFLNIEPKTPALF